MKLGHAIRATARSRWQLVRPIEARSVSITISAFTMRTSSWSSCCKIQYFKLPVQQGVAVRPAPCDALQDQMHVGSQLRQMPAQWWMDLANADDATRAERSKRWAASRATWPKPPYRPRASAARVAVPARVVAAAPTAPVKAMAGTARAYRAGSQPGRQRATCAPC